MKKIFLIPLLSLIPVWGAPTIAEAWIRASVTAENRSVCGFENGDEIQSFTLGVAITPHEIDTELLQSFPSTPFSTPSPMRYVPVLVDREIRCFLLTDSLGTPLSLGYRDLARELNKITALYSISFEKITLYESRQINAYLFSVTPQPLSDISPAPSATPSNFAIQKNLTVLRPGWESGDLISPPVPPASPLIPSSSAPPRLTSESEAIEQLLRTVHQP